MPWRANSCRGPIPESINSCGVLNAPPQSMTSPMALACRFSPAASLGLACARYKRSPLRYSTPLARLSRSRTTRVTSASHSMCNLSGNFLATLNTRSRLPIRTWPRVVSGTRRSPAALAVTCRQSLGSARVLKKPRSRLRRLPICAEASTANSSRTFRQVAVAERFHRHRQLGGQPTVKAMARRVKAGELGDPAFERTVLAVFDALEVAAHIVRPPGGVAGQLRDIVPVRVMRINKDHRVVRRATAQCTGARVEHAVLRRAIFAIFLLALFVGVVTDEVIPTQRRIF